MQALKLTLIGSSALIGLAAFGAPEAKALTDTQLTPGLAFTIPGTATDSASAVTNVLSFAKFNPSNPPIPANRTTITLTDYRYVINPAAFSKDFTVGNFTGSSIALTNISATPSFEGLGTLTGPVSTMPGNATFSGATNPVAPTSFSQFTLGGSAAGYSTWQSLGTPNSQYIGPGTVDSNSYYASWSIVPSGTGLIGGPSAAPNTAQIAGTIKVEYRYSYDLIPSTETPGPLPLLGAGAAFGFSRRLRKRISATV